MNVAYEFSRVKNSFKKVKEDMHALTSKINENYDEFKVKHNMLGKEIEALTASIKEQIEHFRNTKLATHNNNTGVDKKKYDKEILDVKTEIRELKDAVKKASDANFELNSIISKVKKNESDVKELKQKLEASDLEIYLLKERLIEKNVEMKQMKEISSHMLSIIDELSSMELEILNKTK